MSNPVEPDLKSLPCYKHSVCVWTCVGGLIGGALAIGSYVSTKPGDERPLLNPSTAVLIFGYAGMWIGLIKAIFDGQPVDRFLVGLIVLLFGLCIGIACQF